MDIGLPIEIRPLESADGAGRAGPRCPIREPFIGETWVEDIFTVGKVTNWG